MAGADAKLMDRMNGVAARWPRSCVVGLAACVCIVYVAVTLAGVPPDGGAPLWLARGWAMDGIAIRADSWDVMRVALDWLRANPDGGALYDDVFFTQNLKFQYAPTSLLTFELIEALGGTTSDAFLTSINRGVIGLTAGMMGVFAWLLFGGRGGAPASQDARLAQAGAAGLTVVATLVFYPVMFAYALGQIQAWICLLFILAAIAWLLDRRIAAGVLIGLACLIKPQLGLFLVWALLRREWRFAAALAATGAIGLAISIAFYGFAAHIAYLDVLSFISRHGESFKANQSMNGLLHRLFENGDIADWNANGFAPYRPVVYVGTMLTTVVMLVSLFATRRREGATSGLLDFLLAGLVFTMASPVAWEHHYGLLAPVFVALLASLAGGQGSRLLAGGLLALGYVLTSSYATGLGSISASPANLVQSYLFFGAAIVLVLLWRQVGAIILPSLKRSGAAGRAA